MTSADIQPQANRASRLFSSVGIVVASLFLLLLALGTSAFLIFSALERAQVGILSERFLLLGREGGTQIESGLRFGRPLEQFLGLDAIFDGMRAEAPEVGAILVTNAAGVPIAQDASADNDELAGVLADAARRGGSVEPFDIDGERYFVTPLQGREGLAGLLVSSVPLAALGEQRDVAVGGNIAAMLVISGIATAFLAIAAGRLRGAMARPNASRWRWMLFPVVVLLVAQVAYSAFVLKVFHANFAAATVSAADSIGERVQRDLDRLLALGLSFDRMQGLDTQLTMLLDLSGAVSGIEVLDAEGNQRLAVMRPDEESPVLARLVPELKFEPLVRPLVSADGTALGEVRVHVNDASIANGLISQMVNILTVAVTSAFFMIELFVLMQVLFRRAAAHAAAVASGVVAQRPTPAELVKTEPMHLIARPVIFGFVFSWALPLSFLPLKMRNLGTDLFGLPPDVVLALPISVEMGCALVTAILAGRLADRTGWHLPFFAGLVLSAVAGVMAAFAPDGLSFVIARGVTGLGYGLAWMGIQAFVVQYCPSERRGQALANLMAGILAGFITGSAVGGILAEQFGHNVVLLGTAIMVAVPVVIGIAALHGFMAKGAGAAAQRPANGRSELSRWAGLLASPEYMGLLLLSVVPFSIAQVGLLYFAIPLYIDRIGASPSDTGRILMVYGVIVILLGPILSGFVDRMPNKLRVVVIGGMIGGAGLAALMFNQGLTGIMFAAALLSLSSVLIEPARAPYMLNLDVVREVGLASALGFQRAADKLGQMIGPLLIAMAFSGSEMLERVAYVGIGFIVASVALAALVVLRGLTRTTAGGAGS